jgi:hypothetical protein
MNPELYVEIISTVCIVSVEKKYILHLLSRTIFFDFWFIQIMNNFNQLNNILLITIPFFVINTLMVTNKIFCSILKILCHPFNPSDSLFGE